MRLTRWASLHRLAPDRSLLVNALSGAVDLVDDGMRTRLLGLSVGAPSPFSEGERQALVERGYLYDSEEGEEAALAEVYAAYQELASGRLLQFVLCPTYSCNLACSYCFQGAATRAQSGVMSLAQVEAAFAAAETIRATKPGRERQFVLFGGEPLLPSTQETVAAILDRIDDLGCTLQIVTNGTHMERFAPLLAAHPGLPMGVQITLDGPEEIHDARRRRLDGTGSFAQVVQAIDLCLELGLKVNARANIDAESLPSLGALVALMEERGWLEHPAFRCQLAPVTDHVGENPPPFMMREDQLVAPVLALWRDRPELRSKLDFQLFRVLHHLITVMEGGGDSLVLPRFHYCEADRQDMVVFGPDDLMYVCPEAVGDSRGAIGRYAPTYRLWPRRLRGWANRGVLTLPECRRCNIATFCGGGCGYAAIRRHGNPAHGVCAGAPEVVKAYVQELRKQPPSQFRSTEAEVG